MRTYLTLIGESLCKKREQLFAYPLITYVMVFFSCSFCGWLWEGALHLFQDGVWVNRGVLHGPWLPIYGAGCVLILLLLQASAQNKGRTFLTAAGLCALLEYSTGWFLETFLKAKWWDYSGQFLNVHGRICFVGILAFAIGGMWLLYIYAPFLNRAVSRMEERMKVTLTILLISIFLMDLGYSLVRPNQGVGITKPVTQMTQTAQIT